ncbi:MAG: hypothetical protein M3Y87_07195 [Myxococcota bacterium]|nr:hypothetical protein [Myxococcota bacterium]
MTSSLPPEVTRLLWDVDPETVDLRRHADYVMERVMSRGTLAAMRWLRETYARDELASFLERRGDRLAPRERAYWRLIAGLPRADAPGGARPPWAGA